MQGPKTNSQSPAVAQSISTKKNNPKVGGSMLIDYSELSENSPVILTCLGNWPIGRKDMEILTA